MPVSGILRRRSRFRLIGGIVLAFIISFDEVMIATFRGHPTTTLPMRMFQAVQAELDPTIGGIHAIDRARGCLTVGVQPF